jgi:undecaprenyl-diphosphatase
MSSFSTFCTRRLARHEPLGLPLTLGILISTLALLLFLTLAVEVKQSDQDTSFDWACAQAMQLHAEEHPLLLGLLRVITHAGGIPALVVLSVVGVLTLWWRHYRLLAFGWAVAAAGGGLVDLTTKILIDRERPPEALRDAAVTERNESFPSGHAMGSLIGFGMLGYVIVVLVRGRAVRTTVVTLLLVLVLLIGFSRIYLRAHWLTDVLGGFAIGVFWAALCITGVEVVRRRRPIRGEPEPRDATREGG